MAKIDFPDSISSFFNPIAYTGVKAETKKAQSKGLQGSQKSRFFGILEHISGNTVASAGALEEFPVSEETIKELLDEVHIAGDDLKNRPLPGEIIRYKHAVKNFLHYVVKNTYTVDRQQRRGLHLLRRNTRDYVIRLQVVDHKLEQLAAGILAGQTAQLEILSRIEEITGLLIDLLE